MLQVEKDYEYSISEFGTKAEIDLIVLIGKHKKTEVSGVIIDTGAPAILLKTELAREILGTSDYSNNADIGCFFRAANGKPMKAYGYRVLLQLAELSISFESIIYFVENVSANLFGLPTMIENFETTFTKDKFTIALP